MVPQENLSTAISTPFARRRIAASEAARSYVRNEGPQWTETHLPWLVDIMPIDNWLYVAMGISVLFNVMGTGHRFRLWRIDANRVKALTVIHKILGDTLTPAEIYELKPTEEHQSPENLARIDDSLVALDQLRARCRKAENSM